MVPAVGLGEFGQILAQFDIYRISKSPFLRFTVEKF